MITELVLKNFKGVANQTYQFTDFDLLVGRNNSGKSTILQAIAIWQYCIDEFHRRKRSGKSGTQIILPNFTVLPLPEFSLLWTDKTDRKFVEKKQEYIYIEIVVRWKMKDRQHGEFGVKLGYQTPQTIYATPMGGWDKFKEIDKSGVLPRVVYVPPFSGLNPFEKWLDDGVVRQQVGMGQPGSVLRNLLFRVIDRYDDREGEKIRKDPQQIENWVKIQDTIKQWFGITLLPPEYEKGIGTIIEAKYKKDKKGKDFDIIAGGSGFHQTLILLAFYYGYEGVTTILFDEPDAHLHVNLQREILNYFQQLNTTQFIIATHAEELIKRVSPASLYSVLAQNPERIQSSSEVITAMADVDNMAIVSTQQDPFILYVEGEDDERILNVWAITLKKKDVLGRFYVEKMGGGTKDEMRKKADRHFNGLKKIVPHVKRVILFDYDSDDSYHPEPDNEVLFEWRRRNIENYLLVSSAWKRAILEQRKEVNIDLFNTPIIRLVDDFFAKENLTLPIGKSWQNVDANIFKVVNGKKILFEQDDSLFQELNKKFEVKINRECVSRSMQLAELHDDIVSFFEKLEKLESDSRFRPS